MIRIDSLTILGGTSHYVVCIGIITEDNSFAAAIVLKITYGHDIFSVDDLFIRLG